MHIQTPVQPAHGPRGERVWLKMECYQPSGSFKLRGIGALCRQAHESGSRRLVSTSGGNAGMAAAWAAKKLALPIDIVVPESTSVDTRERLAALGAKVTVHGAAWDEADAYARQALDARSQYIPPFDHPTIWQGHATLVNELAKQIDQPGALVVSVGGGGLLLGVLEGLEAAGWENVPVYAVETEGADALYRSLEAGKLLRLDTIGSIAKSLGAKQVAPRAFEKAKNGNIHPLRVTDRQSQQACYDFAVSHRTVVEPACGASLAAVQLGLVREDNVCVVVCGGSAVSLVDVVGWQNYADMPPLQPHP